MQFEHFLYGQFNGLGYRTIASENARLILTDKSFNELCGLRGAGVKQTLLHKERYVAVTYLGYTLDEWGRRNTWNHTILVPMEDYFTLHPPSQFNQYFIKPSDTVPSKLGVLHIK